MKMDIRTLQLQNGTVVRYVKMGIATGRKVFLREGFVSSPNPHYLTNAHKNLIAHYNTVMKVWIIE